MDANMKAMMDRINANASKTGAATDVKKGKRGIQKVKWKGGEQKVYFFGKIISLPFNIMDLNDENITKEKRLNIRELPENFARMARHLYHNDEAVKAKLDEEFATISQEVKASFEITKLEVPTDIEAPITPSEVVLWNKFCTIYAEVDIFRQVKNKGRKGFTAVIDMTKYDEREEGLVVLEPTLMSQLGDLESVLAIKNAATARDRVNTDADWIDKSERIGRIS